MLPLPLYNMFVLLQVYRWVPSDHCSCGESAIWGTFMFGNISAIVAMFILMSMGQYGSKNCYAIPTVQNKNTHSNLGEGNCYELKRAVIPWKSMVYSQRGCDTVGEPSRPAMSGRTCSIHQGDWLCFSMWTRFLLVICDSRKAGGATALSLPGSMPSDGLFNDLL